MSQTRSIHKDYVLSCRAMKQDCGGFRASVALICTAGEKTMTQQFLDLAGVFRDEGDALSRARSAGIDWVDANAKLNNSAFFPTRFLTAARR